MSQFTAAFENASASEAFAKQLGAVLSAYLDTMAQSRDSIDRALAAANVPTRADLAALGARVDALSDKIDRALERSTMKSGKKAKKKSKKAKSSARED